MMWFPGAVLAFLTGVLGVQHLRALPDMAELSVLALLLAVFSWRRSGYLVMLTLGILWTSGFALLARGEVADANWQGRDVTVQGYVDGLPVHSDRLSKFNFNVDPGRDNFPDRLRLSWYAPQQSVKAGQYWKLTVKLKKAHGQYNPGGFDYPLWLASRGIEAVGYVRKADTAELLDYWSGRQNLDRWRQVVADKLDETLSAGHHPGIIKALTIGDRSALTLAQWGVFRRTGTAHLVAISGLHIGLIAGIVYWVILRLWAFTGILSISPQKMACVSALIAAFCYAALAGFAIPARRALIMLSVVLSAQFLQRNISPSRTLFMALFAVVTSDPWSVVSAGFWLSFCAVALILYRFAARLARPGYWRSLLQIHWLTAAGLAPLVMLSFQQVSLIAPVANVLAVPVFSLLVVPLALAGVLMITVLPAFSGFLLWLADEILHYLWNLLAFLSDLPWAALDTGQPALYAVLLALAGVFLLWAPKGFPARYLGLVLLLPVMAGNSDPPAQGEIRLAMLDVGQGLATVVETRSHVLVFDTGAKYSDQFDMGSAAVMPYLRFRGIDKIDTLLISHADNDHSGGARSIMASLPVAKIISSAPEKFAFQSKQCLSGQQWHWDDVAFSLLSPPAAGYFKDENDNSCVLRIATKNKALLLTGDIERDAEQWLVGRYGARLKSHLLIAPHHGSKTSSVAAFLKQIRPDWVLIPAGHGNRYGFPHAEVLTRYRQLGIPWLNSAESGAIIVSSDGETLRLAASREKLAHYWSDW